KEISEEQLIIPADSFLVSKGYQNFLIYKGLRKTFQENKNKLLPLFGDFYTNNLIASNPEFYYSYWLVGDYYQFNTKDFSKAIKYYEMALTKEVPRDNEIDYLNKAIKRCKEKLAKK
ncbi:MAG TPA: hypothetical protein VNW06_05140, partial [Cytophagaceae bacterium]|nr:hypothetical protein [Cytophagaceae bacterium]